MEGESPAFQGIFGQASPGPPGVFAGTAAIGEVTESGPRLRAAPGLRDAWPLTVTVDAIYHKHNIFAHIQ